MRPVHCVVPARMGSSRFPGKPLVKLCGREMVLRTLSRATLAGCFERVICATDSEEIFELARREGFEAVMTPEARTGSDRVAVAAELCGLDLVVNLQGDEPLADLDLLRDVAKELALHEASWVSAASPLKPLDAEVESVVKVRAEHGVAKDFSRRVSVAELDGWAEHRGIYAYSRSALAEFRGLKRSKREVEEAIEPLRVLGLREIRIVQTQKPSASVDVPADVPVLESMIQQEETRCL